MRGRAPTIVGESSCTQQRACYGGGSIQLIVCSLVFVHVMQRARTLPCTNRHTRAQLTQDMRGGQSMATRMATGSGIHAHILYLKKRPGGQ